MVGIVVVNLGTPDSSNPKDVGNYLNEFLMDEDVIDIPFIFRWILVKLLIVPRRKFASAHAYQKIWNHEKGSPLYYLTKEFTESLQKKFKDNPVEFGMRYASNSISQAIEKLKKRGATKIICFPCYPHFAKSSTATVKKEILKWVPAKDLIFIDDYFAEAFFIDSLANKIKQNYNSKKSDHFLFSFHGIPIKQLSHLCHKFDSKECAGNNASCEAVDEKSRFCYQAQCYVTADLIAKKLQLPKEKYSVSFQSRLGRAEWTKPNTEVVLKELAQKGVKNLDIVCPSFTTDCLETLEEIKIRGNQLFLDSGGMALTYHEALNASPEWVSNVYEYINEIK